MRERHHHCAICGGPLRGSRAKISRKPRTAEFLRRQERRQRAGESASGDDVDPDSQYDSSEERTYDPEIIYDSQTGWLDEVLAIGYNPASPHLDKHVKLSILSLPSNAMQGVHYPSRNSCTSRKSSHFSRNKDTRLQTDGRELSRIYFGWEGVHV